MMLKNNFPHLQDFVTELSDNELKTIIQGYRNNSQLQGCFDVEKHLIPFILKTTGKQCKFDEMKRNVIIDHKESKNETDSEDDAPF